MWISDFGMLGYDCDTMGERIGRIGRMDTDFFYFSRISNTRIKKKSVSIRQIRPIRSPIVSPSYHHRITTFRNPKSTFRNRNTISKTHSIIFE
jgi:hypothetical protein